MSLKVMTELGKYRQIMERVFFARYEEGARVVEFTRDDIEEVAEELGFDRPKNIGDVIYNLRYRSSPPESIRAIAGEGEEWFIRGGGSGVYRFELGPPLDITPNRLLSETKVPDATPGIVTLHSLEDEQALLAKLRYNRLIDIFTSITCYSLQNHLRAQVSGIGQVETDEVYVGVSRKGAQYVLPVQAKGGSDRQNLVQIEQDFPLCAKEFPSLICQAIGAQFMEDNLIALFEFEETDEGVAQTSEEHYRLVSPERLSEEDLRAYRERTREV